MRLNRSLRDPEGTGYLLVARASRDARENIDLALSEVLTGHPSVSRYPAGQTGACTTGSA